MKNLIVVLGVITLLLAACGGIKFQAKREVGSLVLDSFIPLETKVDKAITDPTSGTVYALHRAQQQVFIYKGKELVNTIGGLGSMSYNFQRLTDIALNTDGNLLALDQMAATIKKFTSDGRYIASLELKDLIQPELLCLNLDGELFVYDAAPGEIVNVSLLDGKEINRFGRFQFQNPTAISCNRELISVYSASEGSSKVFDSFGQFIQERAGQVLADIHGNLLLVDKQISTLPYSAWHGEEEQQASQLLPILEAGEVTIFHDVLTHSGVWGINIFKIKYKAAEQ
jgi:hypothetical protein